MQHHSPKVGQAVVSHRAAHLLPIKLMALTYLLFQLFLSPLRRLCAFLGRPLMTKRHSSTSTPDAGRHPLAICHPAPPGALRLALRPWVLGPTWVWAVGGGRCERVSGFGFGRAAPTPRCTAHPTAACCLLVSYKSVPWAISAIYALYFLWLVVPAAIPPLVALGTTAPWAAHPPEAKHLATPKTATAAAAPTAP